MGNHGNTGTQDGSLLVSAIHPVSTAGTHTNILASGTLLEELPTFCDKTDLKLHQIWAPEHILPPQHALWHQVAQSNVPAFPVSPRGTTAPTVPEYTSQKWVTLCWCLLQLSPEQNHPKMTCLCHTFQLKGLASHLWRAAGMHRTHCRGSAGSCGHFLSWHLADRLRVTRYDHFRKISYCEEQRFVCNERRTRSLVGAI